MSVAVSFCILMLDLDFYLTDRVRDRGAEHAGCVLSDRSLLPHSCAEDIPHKEARVGFSNEQTQYTKLELTDYSKQWMSFSLLMAMNLEFTADFLMS